MGMFQKPILSTSFPHRFLLKQTLPPVPRRALRRGISHDRSKSLAHMALMENMVFLEQPELGTASSIACSPHRPRALPAPEALLFDPMKEKPQGRLWPFSEVRTQRAPGPELMELSFFPERCVRGKNVQGSADQNGT